MNDTDIVTLQWRPLVNMVRRGEFEPRDETGRLGFMYSESRHAFISDQRTLEQITYARSHSRPFMLIGKLGTGKNVFLELVARGKSPDSRIECVDENIVGSSEADMLEKFFGPNGMVQQHPNSLFHFDLLQNALTWPIFMDKLFQLAESGVLYRTDGSAVRGLGIRVVGGATVDLEQVRPDLARELPNVKYLYERLRANQLARTSPLVELRHRMTALLAEILASQVLDERAETSIETIRLLEVIPNSVLFALQKYDWPDEFYELVRFVRTCMVERRWAIEVLRPAPLKRLRTFISYSSLDSDRIADLRTFLESYNIDPWIDKKDILPGADWKREIDVAVDDVDVALVCLSKRALSKTGYFHNEIGRLLERVQSFPAGQIFLIPLRLEPCEVPKELRRYQFADFFEQNGRNDLLASLRNCAGRLGRAPLVSDGENV